MVTTRYSDQQGSKSRQKVMRLYKQWHRPISKRFIKPPYSISNAARLSFSDLCILLFMFLSLCRLCVCVFLCSHWSLVDVPLIFFCPADHVPDWQPRVLLGMVEARSVNVKKTTTTTTIESNLDRLGMLSPTHDQRSQQKTGKITLQPVLINKSKFLKATHFVQK